MQAVLEALFEKFPNRNRDDLIPILQEVQNQMGYLSAEAILLVGRHLSISENKVYGVATFYDNFRFSPKGHYHIKVCNGTACHICGSNILISELVKHLELNQSQTTKDGLFSVEFFSCMGGCAQAPVVEVNNEYYVNLTPGKLIQLIQKFREKGIDETP